MLMLAMPYMRGGDLNWYIVKQGKMTESEIKYYGSEMLIGLQELRRWQIVWRDLKPENCLFNDDGHIVLTDFGISGRLDETNNYKLKSRFGTPHYMGILHVFFIRNL